jgi:hypothetical protein
MVAGMKTWRSSHHIDLYTFKYRQDFDLYGRRHTTDGDEYSLSGSEYVDNMAFIFTSREDARSMTPLVVEHFTRWGMNVYVSKNDKESKSQILFCAKDAQNHTYVVNLSPIM